MKDTYKFYDKITDNDKIFLFYLRKFPWISRDTSYKYFYKDLSYDQSKIRRTNNLVKQGLVKKHNRPFHAFSISLEGYKYVESYKSIIKKIPSSFNISINSNNISFTYLPPKETEINFSNFSHTEKLTDLTLYISSLGRYDVVEAADFISNRTESLLVKGRPDIVLMRFKDTVTQRILIELENSTISLKKVIQKISQSMTDNESYSSYPKIVKDIFSQDVVTRHFFLFTEKALVNKYIKTIREFLHVCFDRTLDVVQWEKLWHSKFDIKYLENKYHFKRVGLENFIQDRKMYFGEFYDIERFLLSSIYTFDHDFYLENFPVAPENSSKNGASELTIQSLFSN